MLAGAHLFDLDQTLNLSGNGLLGFSVNNKLSKSLWDGIFGIKRQVIPGDERK